MKGKKKKYLKKVLNQLQPLTKLSPLQQKKIVPLLSDNCIHKICESCQNLLSDNLKLNSKKLQFVKSTLQKSRQNIRDISKPNTSLLRKREILSSYQTGKGIFSILTSVIVPSLIALLNKKT